jgi:hypothetical protein
MVVRRKYQVSIIAVLLALSIGIFAGRQQTSMTGTAGADPSGHVSIKAYRDGELFYEYEDHNLITTNGSRRIRNFLGWDNETGATIHLSLSNDAAPLVDWTKLPGEITTDGLDRATGAPAVVNSTAYTVTYLWTASAGPVSVQCTGLHWDATDDSDYNLFAAASISSVSLQANDKLDVTWTVNIPDG